MKKSICIFFLCLFLFILAGFSADGITYVKVEDPGVKNSLKFDLDQLKTIAEDLKGEETAGSFQLVNPEGIVMANLGTLKDGEIQWSQQIIDEKFLQVTFDKKSDFESILSKIKQNVVNPGVQVQYSDAQNTPMATCEITFTEAPDLVLTVKVPLTSSPGAFLKDNVSVDVFNRGLLEAKDVTVDLVLSTDMQIPDLPTDVSATFKEDAIMSGGQKTIPVVKPGEKVTVTFDNTLKFPADAPYGKYYLAAILDKDNKISELSEINNRDIRMVMVTMPEPKRIIVNLPEAELLYTPANSEVSVSSNGLILSQTAEWRKCNFKTPVFQIKHVAWEDFLWEVDTVAKTVTHVKTANFCKKGGEAKALTFAVEPTGGTATTLPDQVIIKLSDARIEYAGQEGKFKILTDDNQIAYVSFWQIAKTQPGIYQVKNQAWGDTFLEIDISKKEVRLIKDGKFGYEGGTATVLPLTVKVEE